LEKSNAIGKKYEGQKLDEKQAEEIYQKEIVALARQEGYDSVELMSVLAWHTGMALTRGSAIVNAMSVEEEVNTSPRSAFRYSVRIA
jgi:hypothetical protein